MADIPKDDSEENRSANSNGPADQGAGAPVWRSRPCPVCQKMSDQKYRPFCSKRCADVDLARWLGGNYAIPARPQDEDQAD
jgi:endogenous inhibitor of DNA gyrase (YacG/DUF329 family)